MAASKKYRFVGTHAETLYKGDKAIPVGHGLEPIAISEDDFNDERNAHLRDSFVEDVKVDSATVEKGGEK